MNERGKSDEERDRAAELKKSVSLFASTLEATADGILVVDETRKIVVYNRKFLELWRIPLDVIESRDDRRLVEFIKTQLVEPNEFVESVERSYANPTAPCFSRLELVDKRVFERYCQPQMLDGAVVGRVWSFRDVTARERAEADLRRSEELFRTLIENAEDLITIFNRDWTIRYESPAIEKIIGYKPSELRGRSLLEIVHPDERRAILKAMRYKIEHPGETVRVHTRIRHKNGGYRVLEGLSVNLLDNPAVAGIVSNTRDVTESEQTEAALRTSEERYRTIFDRDLAANSISTPDARLLDCNSTLR